MKERADAFKIISNGISYFDKVHLVIYSLLLQVPKSLQKKIPKYFEVLNIFVQGTTVRCLGCLFNLNTHDDVRFHTNGIFEREIQGWFKIPEGGVFLDVGANIGRYTITLAKKVGPGGRVIAFEPCSNSYSALRKNIDLNNLGNVITLPLALWNEEGYHHMYVKANAGSNSLVEDNGAIGKEKVRTITLDGLLKELIFTRIDLIKIDVEGAEREVLEGMKKTLQHFKPSLIIEVRDDNVSWVENFLNLLGYTKQDKQDINHLYESI